MRAATIGLIGVGGASLVGGAALGLIGKKQNNSKLVATGGVMAVLGGTAAATGVFLLRRAPAPAAVHDVALGKDLLKPHHVSAKNVDTFLKNSQTTGRWVHQTSQNGFESIVRNGPKVSGLSASQSTYGSGLYLSREPIMAYGDKTVPMVVNAQNPLRYVERGFQNKATFDTQIAPLIKAFKGDQPEIAAKLSQQELTRSALRHAGFDSILITKQGHQAKPWLVALDDSILRVVTR